jgi:hypothetical protein
MERNEVEYPCYIHIEGLRTHITALFSPRRMFFRERMFERKKKVSSSYPTNLIFDKGLGSSLHYRLQFTKMF